MRDGTISRRFDRRALGKSTRTRMQGRIPPLLATAASGFVLLALAAGISLVRTPASLAGIESRLHEADRFAEFVNREAPSFELTAGDGNPVRLEDFRGKPVVLNFIYARCMDICPPHMALLADLQQGIRAAALAEQIELITLATDSEEAAATARLVRNYGERFGLRESNWRMLYRGDRPPRTVIDLAAEYGLQFRLVTSDDRHSHGRRDETNHVERQVHGAVFHIIDSQGRMRARLHGMRFQPQTLITYLKALAERGGAG